MVKEAESIEHEDRQNHLYIVATEGGSGCEDDTKAHCASCMQCIRDLVEQVSPDIRDAFDVRHCHVLSHADSGSHDNSAWLKDCGSAFRRCMSRIVDRHRRIIMLSSVEDAPHIANLVTHAAQPKLLSNETVQANGSVVIAVSPEKEPSERLKVLERAMRASKGRMNGRMSLLIGRRFLPLPGLQLTNGQLVSRFGDMGGVDKNTQNLYFGQEMPEHFPQGSDEEGDQGFAVDPVAEILVTNGGEDAVNDLYSLILSTEIRRGKETPLPQGVVFGLHSSSSAYRNPSESSPITLTNARQVPSIIVNEEGGYASSEEIDMRYVVDGRTKGMNPLEAKMAFSHWLGNANASIEPGNPDLVMAYIRQRLEQYLT